MEDRAGDAGRNGNEGGASAHRRLDYHPLAEAGADGVPPATTDLSSLLPWQCPGSPQLATSLTEVARRSHARRATGDTGQSGEADRGRRWGQVGPSRAATAPRGAPASSGTDLSPAHAAGVDPQAGHDGAKASGHSRHARSGTPGLGHADIGAG